MRTLFGLILATTLGCAVHAQTLSDRYEEIGGVTGDINGKALALTSLFDTEKDRSHFQIRDTGTAVVLSASAGTIGDEGKLVSPRLSVTIGPIMTGIPGIRGDAIYSDETGYYAADNDLKNRFSIDDLEYSETSMTFSVSTELLPVKRNSDGVFAIDPDRSPIQLNAQFSGTPQMK